MLLSEPTVEKYLAPDILEDITQNVGRYINDREPLYIRILIGLGAWLAAVFFICAIEMVLWDKEILNLIIGIVLLAAGITVAKKVRFMFIQQLCLASVFAGNSLAVIALTRMNTVETGMMPVIFQLFICAAVYPLFNNSVYRFIAPGAVAVLAIIWFYDENVLYCIHILIAVEMLLAGILFLRKKNIISLMPLAYSAAFMLPVTILIMNLMNINLYTAKMSVELLPSSLTMGCGLLYLLFYVTTDKKYFRNPLIVLAIVSTVLLAAFTTPGILIAIGLLVLGYARHDKILTTAAFLFMPCFLVLFYYSLDVDLAYKSFIVGGSGVFLLIVRWIAAKLQSFREAA